MKTIYKYQVPIKGRFSLTLPKEAVILSFQKQRGIPVIWAQINTGHNDEDRKFRLYGTGHPIKNIPQDIGLHYIGTIQQNFAEAVPALVWHLFEEVKECTR